jgi:archaemetzincin
MSVLHLLPVGTVDGSLLVELRRGLANAFNVRCDIIKPALDPEFAFHPERVQYHSTELLQRLEGEVRSDCWRLLGVSQVDLFMPILTFVFGEAQIDNKCAVVSTHRLQQEFYGLPSDRQRVHERLLKEAVHELGHTLGLMHCHDYGCAMAASHSVEWIDIKSREFCLECFSRVQARIPEKKLFGIF